MMKTQRLLAAASKWVLLVALLVLFAAPSAQAQVPTQVPFQGLLLDSGGQPLTGSVDLQFELFDDLAAGTSLWAEAQPGVMVVDGVYSVTLGASTPITAVLIEGGSAFLAITVDGELLTPRQQLLAVPYALRAAEADNVGSVSSVFIEQMIETFPFDGAPPGNTDPSEGTGDTDSDGIPNFVDPDNDNDGISDAEEFAEGSSINLETPSISLVQTAGPVISYLPNVLTVTGTNLETLSAVTFGSESPLPTQLTDMTFEISVTPNELNPTLTVQVSLPNGEMATSSPLPIVNETPVIDLVTPPFADGSSGQMVIDGSGFAPGVTVQFGSQTLTPSMVSRTSLTVPYGAEPAGPKQLVVFHPNGLDSGPRTYNVADPAGGRFVFVTAGLYDGNLGGLAGADAICQAEADAESLPGTYLAWLSDSTSSPSTRFSQQGSFFRVDAEPIAFSWADLIDGTIEQPINLMPSGVVATGVVAVWTDTMDDGTAIQGGVNSCQNWTSSGTSGAPVGLLNNTTNWSNVPGLVDGCFRTRRLYCFQE
ncbi:MAG: IPT/TIG domain-containing protein [Myxococcota bacterium]